jgi:hypothetical protein
MMCPGVCGHVCGQKQNILSLVSVWRNKQRVVHDKADLFFEGMSGPAYRLPHETRVKEKGVYYLQNTLYIRVF